MVRGTSVDHSPSSHLLQLSPQPEWEQRMFPGDSDEMPLQFHRRQRAAGASVEVSETQGAEDHLSEAEGVEWGSREWERLRLEEKVIALHLERCVRVHQGQL